MKISVGQALLILLAKYRGIDKDKYNELKHLYLAGAKDADTQTAIDKYLKDSALVGYQVSKAPEDITHDNSRRYFETHLAYETLSSQLDKLSAAEISQHLDAVKGTAYSSYAELYEDILQGIYTPSDDTEREYADYLTKLRNKEIFSQFSNEQRQKIIEIVSAAFVAMIIASQGPHLLPLDIYGEDIYLERGKVTKEGQRTATKSAHGPLINMTTTSTLGLLQNRDPVPLDDPARMTKTQEFLKPSDQSTYDPSARWVQDNFSRLVHPFSNSISGTMLCQLRALAKIKELNKLADHMDALEKPSGGSTDPAKTIDDVTKKTQIDLVISIMDSGKVTEEVLAKATELVKNGQIADEVIKHIKKTTDEALLASKEKLGSFFKLYVSALLFNAGGHSLHEFVAPIGLAKTQQEFAYIDGFNTLDLEELFLNTNQDAFDKALDKAIAYNEQILKKKAIKEELKGLKQVVDQKVIPELILASQLSSEVKTNLLELAKRDVHHAADCFRLVEKLQQLMIKNDVRVQSEYFSFFRQGAQRQVVLNKNLNNAIIELSKGNEQQAKSIIEATLKELKTFKSEDKPEFVSLQNIYNLIGSQVIKEQQMQIGKS
ncbi:Uncharacterised protein [Legionella steigerwaltii]|uniref:Uncharacterized protein n=1 Tax=Legionella steigerwaltii TaxID=460 RepID=A0A378L875_9GAMM|nr:hypothetical protein [Legionella steigerwaltii]KTD72129.1 hypothetical protein Lstg_2640 [Legionella steigerwaltii]STY21889.1 Uncharacterised protein [Legionella steigerwaltii]